MPFTSADKEKEEWAKNFDWDSRTRPEEFDPVQLNSNMHIPGGFIDWWNTRSQLFCCCLPLVKCCFGINTINSIDPSIWKEQIEKSDERCPQSMRGLWWCKYNQASEELVTIFGDATFIGSFNEDGTDGYGFFRRLLKDNWSRDYAAFGLALAIGSLRGSGAKGRLNLKDGKMTIEDGENKSQQMIYRISDDEWWKVKYKGNLEDQNGQEVENMYKWLKVIDADGTPTKYWDEYVEWATEPLPNTNCGTSWCPLWPVFMSQDERFEDMVRPNVKQLVILRH